MRRLMRRDYSSARFTGKCYNPDPEISTGHHISNLLPQAIGRKTPDKRNRHTSAMARPASRKAVSSLPAIANIDEQLDEVVMDLSKFITPVRSDEVEYVIIGGRRDGERGVIDKSVHTINGDGIYHKKQITCGGYTATFFVSSDMGDATPGEVVSILCHGYRKPK